MRRGAPEAALAQADRAVALAPTDPSYLLLRGQILHAMERTDEARRSLERAYSLDPHHPGAALPYALDLDAAGETAAAAAVLAEVVRRHPEQEDARWLVGLAHLRAARAAEAEQAFTELIRRAERSGSPYGVPARLGRALARESRAAGSGLADFTAAAHQDIETTLAVAAGFMGTDLEKTLRELAAAAAAADPGDAPLALAEAGVLQLTGFSDQAVAVADRVLAAEVPADLRVQLLLVSAAAEGDRTRYAGARERLREALDLAPDRLDALRMLQEAVVRGGGTPEDVADLRERMRAALERIDDPRARMLLEEMERSLQPAGGGTDG